MSKWNLSMLTRIFGRNMLGQRVRGIMSRSWHVYKSFILSIIHHSYLSIHIFILIYLYSFIHIFRCKSDGCHCSVGYSGHKCQFRSFLFGKIKDDGTLLCNLGWTGPACDSRECKSNCNERGYYLYYL